MSHPALPTHRVISSDVVVVLEWFVSNQPLSSLGSFAQFEIEMTKRQEISRGGEVAQTMCTHVNKRKSDKIK
jgi:hypothetical protein